MEILLIIPLIYILWAILKDNQKTGSIWGDINPMLICPHCSTKGKVRAKPVNKKVGVSGAKATAALLTAGTSLFVAGLSRKGKFTQAHCDNCDSTWNF